jgi:hypothetical protein
VNRRADDVAFLTAKGSKNAAFADERDRSSDEKRRSRQWMPRKGVGSSLRMYAVETLGVESELLIPPDAARRANTSSFTRRRCAPATRR